jgi:hypothetical protein
MVTAGYLASFMSLVRVIIFFLFSTKVSKKKTCAYTDRKIITYNMALETEVILAL